LQHGIVRAKGRFVIRFRTLALAAVLLGALAARPALAQTTGTAGTTGTIGTTSLVAADFFLAVQDQSGVSFPPFDLVRFFNKANCDCDVPVKIFASMSQQGFAKRSLVDQTAHISVWIGTACDNVTLQNTNCVRLIDESLSEFFTHGHEVFDTTARVLSTYTGSNGAIADGGVVGASGGGFKPNTDCTSPISPFNQTIWLLVDTTGDSVNDVSPPATTQVRIDLAGPPLPVPVRVEPGNEAVNVSWSKLDVATNGDLQGYQIFCQRGSGLQVFSDNTFSTPIKSCATTRGGGVQGLDPLFACSPLLSRATASYRVKILQNGIPYGATVVAVDDSGNASEPDLQFAVPEKTNSFYDVYRMGDPPTAGQASGGFCAVAPGAATGPLAAASGAALALAAVLALRRRRRRP
jgi:hypothetical protein